MSKDIKDERFRMKLLLGILFISIYGRIRT